MNTKRIMLLMGVMLLAAALPVLPVAADNGAAITVEAPAEVFEGDSFVARVNIDDVTNLFAAEYTVSFDDAVFELVNVTAGVVGGKAFPVSVYNPAIYKVVQSAPSLADAVSGSGYLAELHFNVIGSVEDTSGIDLAGGMLANTEAQAIPATWTGASVEVVEVPPPPPPPETPVGGTANPVSRLPIVALWIAVAAAIIAGAGLFVRHRRAQS